MNPIIVLILFQSAGISPKHYLIETKQVTWEFSDEFDIVFVMN